MHHILLSYIDAETQLQQSSDIWSKNTTKQRAKTRAIFPIDQSVSFRKIVTVWILQKLSKPPMPNAFFHESNSLLQGET